MCLNVRELINSIWSAPPISEVVQAAGKRARRDKNEGDGFGHHWVWTEQITPVKMYCLLKALHGPPNGFQMLLRKDDTDNLIHWSWELECANTRIHIDGFFFYFSIGITGLKETRPSDEGDFRKHILSLIDRYQQEIELEKSKLEEWKLFLNPYYHLTKLVHDTFSDLQNVELPKRFDRRPESPKELSSQSDLNENISRFYSLGFTLNVTIPIWIESFVNLIIFLLARPELRKNLNQFRDYRRAPIMTRIRKLSQNCIGFNNPVDPNSDVLLKLAKLFEERNRVLHGAVVPNLYPEGTIYFDARTIPLLDRHTYMTQFLTDILLHETAEGSIEKKISLAESFWTYILGLMKDPIAGSVLVIMGENVPGWDESRQRAGVVLPPVFVDGFMVMDKAEEGLVQQPATNHTKADCE